jgi:hypothetical protein
MALPISATPVLEGKDAKRFYKQMKIDSKRKIPSKEIAAILALVKRNEKTVKLLCGDDDLTALFHKDEIPR